MPVHEGKYPLTADGWTPALMTELISGNHPGVRVSNVTVVEASLYGDQMVSTSGRTVLDLDYEGASADLPRRMLVKQAQLELSPEALYDNEVGFYGRLRPEIEIETVRAFGCGFDRESCTYALLLEDLRQRGVTFPNVTVAVSLDSMRSLLDLLARLHARYWQSPRFSGDLSWVQTHVSGPLHEKFHRPDALPVAIADRVAAVQFKREMVQRMGVTVDDLYNGFKALQHHQSRLPNTLLHGDTHIGNTYLLPDGSGGLLDWQLFVRGYCLHDVSYVIATGLAIEDRRKHERDLLRYYLDRLKAHGVAEPPSFDDAWTEYRRASVWNVYIGWLTTPVVNYGWEISIMAHLRVMTAFEDLETKKLLAEMR